MIHHQDDRALDEHTWLLAALAGDERAFGWLLDRHRHGLEVFCHFMLGNRDAARQAVAETVLTAWCERQNVQTPTTVRTWLYRIAVHVCMEAIEGSAVTR